MPEYGDPVAWSDVVALDLGGYGATALLHGGLSYECRSEYGMCNVSGCGRLSFDGALDRAPVPLLICDNFAMVDDSAVASALSTLVVRGPMSTLAVDRWAPGGVVPFGAALAWCGWAADAVRHAALGVPLWLWDGSVLRPVVGVDTSAVASCGSDAVDALFGLVVA